MQEDTSIRPIIEELRYNRRNRFMFLTSLISLLIGLSLLMMRSAIEFLNKIDFVIYQMITVAFIMAGVGSLLYWYLQSGKVKSSLDISTFNQDVLKELSEMRVELFKLKKNKGDNESKDDLNLLVRNYIEDTLTDDFILNKVSNVYSEHSISMYQSEKLSNSFSKLSIRIDNELNSLNKKANINLIIGAITTICAIVPLAIDILGNTVSYEDYVALMSHYIPRLTLIVFIEVFAFFFLKLYKTCLQDIMYYNNEKTNIECKKIALEVALDKNESDLTKLAIEELVRTERNFKLKKNETTVELEKNKIADVETKNQIQSLLGLLLKK